MGQPDSEIRVDSTHYLFKDFCGYTGSDLISFVGDASEILKRFGMLEPDLIDKTVTQVTRYATKHIKDVSDGPLEQTVMLGMCGYTLFLNMLACVDHFITFTESLDIINTIEAYGVGGATDENSND